MLSGDGVCKRGSGGDKMIACNLVSGLKLKENFAIGSSCSLRSPSPGKIANA